jgi:hypothetical protein
MGLKITSVVGVLVLVSVGLGASPGVAKAMARVLLVESVPDQAPVPHSGDAMQDRQLFGVRIISVYPWSCFRRWPNQDGCRTYSQGV